MAGTKLRFLKTAVMLALVLAIALALLAIPALWQYLTAALLVYDLLLRISAHSPRQTTSGDDSDHER